MNNTKKLELLFIMILLFGSIAQGLLTFRGKYYDNTDSQLVNFIAQRALSITPLTLWYKNFYLGFPTSQTQTPINLIITGVNYLYVSTLGPIIGSELFYTELTFIAAYGMFSLILVFLNEIDEYVKLLAAFLGAILFAFFFQANYGPEHILAFVFLPIAILFLTKLSFDQKRNWLHIGLAIISMAFFLGTSFIPASIILILPICFILVMASKNRKELAITLSLVLIVALLINLNAIVSALIFFKNTGSTFYQGVNSIATNSTFILLKFNNENPLSALQIYGVNPNSIMFAYAKNSVLVSLVQMLIVGMGITAIFSFKIYNKYKFVLLGLFLSLIIVIIIYCNQNPPFGFIFSILLSISKVMLIFRDSDPIFYFCIFFLEAILFAFGFGYISTKLKGKIKFLFIGLVVLLIAIHVYYFDWVPLNNGHAFQIPNYAFQTASYINTNINASEYNVATLPAEYPFGHYATYYYGTDIYSYLIKASVFTGGYTTAASASESPTEYNYFEFANSIQNIVIKNTSYISKSLAEY